MAKNKGRNKMQQTQEVVETPEVVEQQEVVETPATEVNQVQEETKVVEVMEPQVKDPEVQPKVKAKPTFRTATGEKPEEEVRHSGKLNLFKQLLREAIVETASNIPAKEAIAGTRKLHNAVDILFTKLVGSELSAGIKFITALIAEDTEKTFHPTRLHRFTNTVCKSSADVETFTLQMRLLVAYAKSPETYTDMVDVDFVLSKVKGMKPRRAEHIKASFK